MSYFNIVTALSSVTPTYPLLAPDGSSSAPSYAFSSQPLLGFYRVTTDFVRLVGQDTTTLSIWNSGTNDDSVLELANNSSSTGDQYIDFKEDGVTASEWRLGRDDSASGAFKLSQGAALGTNDFLSCTTAGAWTLGASGSTAAHAVNGTSIGLQASGANNPSLNLFAATGQNRNGVISIRGTNTGGASLQSSYTTSFYDGTTNRTIGEIDIYSTSAVGSTSGGQMKFVTSKTDGTQVFAMVIDENQTITLGASGSSAQHVLNGRFLDLQASSVGVAGLLITNANNAAAGAHAEVELNVGGTSGGDPYIRMNISGGQGWSAGVDNSDGDKYKVSASPAVGTNDYLIGDPTGLWYMPSGLLAGGGASSRLFTESGVESWINSTSGTTRQSMALYARNVSTGNTAQGTNYFDAGGFLTVTRQTSANTSENTSFLAGAVVQLDFNTANGTTYTNTGYADGLIMRQASQSNTGTVALTSLNGIRFEDASLAGVTRKNHILFGALTGATNQAFISDGIAYTGNYGINLQTAYHHTFLAPICSQRLDVASAATITALSSAQGFIKLTGSTATALQGITAGKDGQRLTLVNLTGANLTVQNENAGATAANRITTMTGADVATTTNGAAEFIYDTGSSRWICLYVTA